MTKNNGIAPTVFTTHPIAEIEESEAAAVEYKRGDGGRFVAGTGGPGRQLGSKNKLSEDFVTDVLTVWHESGIEALRLMVKDEPGAFVRCVAGLMPRDILLEAKGAGLVVVRLSDEDMAL